MEPVTFRARDGAQPAEAHWQGRVCSCNIINYCIIFHTNNSTPVCATSCIFLLPFYNLPAFLSPPCSHGFSFFYTGRVHIFHNFVSSTRCVVFNKYWLPPCYRVILRFNPNVYVDSYVFLLLSSTVLYGTEFIYWSKFWLFPVLGVYKYYLQFL